MASRSSRLSLAWMVWGLAACFYFSDYLARVAPGVMHRDLQAAFGINEAGFGTLTASFYIPYVLMQIPVGLMVDRLSVRGLLTVMSLITAFGCVVFGYADTLFVASIGRMLIGFSAAFAFVCSLRLATSWFPPTMLGLLSGLTQALGMLGAASGQAPVSFLVSQVGWRDSMFIMSALFVCLSLLLYQYVRDNPDRVVLQHKKTEHSSIFSLLITVLKHPQSWINAFYAGFLFAPTAVIGEALGPAFLQFGRGLTLHQAAFATGLIFIGWGISGPFSGWLSDKMGRRKPLMILTALCGILFTSLFVYMPNLSVKSIYIIFFCYGLTNTGVAIAYAVCTELHPRNVVGTALGFTNMASIFVGALMQPVVGYLVDSVAGVRSYHVETLILKDFQAGLWLLPVCSCVALVLALFVRETYCRPVE